MPADLPTRWQDARPVADIGRDVVSGVRNDGADDAELVRRIADVVQGERDCARRLFDFYASADDAPERTFTPAERAMWGTCPVCGAVHGEPCRGPMPPAPAVSWHTARLDAAPLRVRMVAVP